MHLNIIGDFSGPSSDLANAYHHTISNFLNITSYDIITGPLQNIATVERSRRLECRGVTFVAVPPPECLTAHARASVDGGDNINIGILTHPGSGAPWEWRDILRLCGYAEIWVPNRAAMASIQMVTDIPVYFVPPMVSTTVPRQRMRALPTRDENKFVFLAGHWASGVVSQGSLMATVDAYRGAFGADERTRLVVCDSGASDELVAHCNRHDVVLVRSVVLRSEFVRLVAGADAFVSLCDSVSFDMPVLEAMAQAVPVVGRRLACRGQYRPSNKLTPTAERSAASVMRWAVDNRVSITNVAANGRDAVLGLCGPDASRSVISARLASLWVTQPRCLLS